MKTLIPWVLVVALLAGVYFLYASGKEKDNRLVAAQMESQELTSLRAEVDDLRKVMVLTNEMARLRRDNEDLLRLRSEVNQLRNDGKQLSNQLQTAQTQRAQAQQQQQAAQQAAMQAQAQAQAAAAQAQNAAQVQGLRQGQEQAQPQNPAQAQAMACINNLRQIDGAKQTWALENKKPANAIPTPTDIAAYLRGGVFNLACPAGGTYTLNGLTAAPTCSVPGHAIDR